MRKSQTQPIKEVITAYLREVRIDQKLKEVGLVSAWGDIMGKTVASLTRQVYIRKRTLFIIVASPIVRNELSMMRQNIADRFNELAGEKLIDQVVIR